MLKLCLVIAVTLCWLGMSVDARNPGFKARITARGLNYANKAAIEALAKNIKQIKIPDISGKTSGISYKVTGMSIPSFTPPESMITLVPQKGLSWKAVKAALTVHGNFHAKKWIISVSGSFDISISDMAFNIGIDLGDSHGHPELTSAGCSCSLGSVKVEIHGGAAWILNLFKGKIADAIKSALQGQLCTVIQKEINQDGNKKLQSLPMTTPLAKKFLLDYRLVAPPEFAATYMETFHKGEIYWLNDTTEAPFSAQPMKDSSATLNMMYLWVSDYIFETIAYNAQKHNFLMYNLTAKDLPADQRGVLNTTCEGFIPKCVGKLIPAIGQKYPNSQVELHMVSTMVPNMTIAPSGVSVRCGGQINMYANTPSKQKPFLVTLNANMSTTVAVSVVNETIHAKIDKLTLKLTAGKSAIGPIDQTALQFLIDTALTLYIEPQLNALGKKGFPLPVTDDIKFINTDITFEQDTIIIGTDLKYTPKMTRKPKKAGDKDTSLRYKPSGVDTESIGFDHIKVNQL